MTPKHCSKAQFELLFRDSIAIDLSHPHSLKSCSSSAARLNLKCADANLANRSIDEPKPSPVLERCLQAFNSLLDLEADSISRSVMIVGLPRERTSSKDPQEHIIALTEPEDRCDLLHFVHFTLSIMPHLSLHIMQMQLTVSLPFVSQLCWCRRLSAPHI